MLLKRKPILAILLCNIAILVIGIVSLELLWGDWIGTSNGINHLNLIKNATFHYRVGNLYPSKDIIQYSRDRYGFRGNYDSPGQIDILTLGGSTTDQRYITDSKTWQNVLRACFEEQGKAVSVVNAGIDGQSSYGNIKSFERWFPHIEGFRPRYILFYIGLNDLHRQEDHRKDDLAGERSWKSIIQSKSILYHLYRTVKGVYIAKFIANIGHQTLDFQTLTWVGNGIIDGKYDEIMEGNLNVYARHLYILSMKTRQLGAKPVFVTQQSRHYRIKDDKVLGVNRVWKHHGTEYNGVDRYYMMKRLNAKTMEVCRQTGSICIDLADELVFEDDDFYDFVHNTPQGTAKIGRFLHSKLDHLF